MLQVFGHRHYFCVLYVVMTASKEENRPEVAVTIKSLHTPVKMPGFSDGKSSDMIYLGLIFFTPLM